MATTARLSTAEAYEAKRLRRERRSEDPSSPTAGVEVRVAPEPTEPRAWWREILPQNVAFDPKTAERIGHADVECSRGCLTWEEHLGHASQANDAPPATTWSRAFLPAAVAEDIDSMMSLLGQQEWKAAALVGGAALEAVLVAHLEARPWEAFRNTQLALGNSKRDDGARWHKPLREWGLYGLIRCAGALAVFSAAGEAACHEARRVRNAIHGGAVGRSEAQAVLAALAVATGAAVAGGRL